MAVHWRCPRCGYYWHSAWPREDHNVVQCEKCEEIFKNFYYNKIELTKADIWVILCKIGDITCNDCQGGGEEFDPDHCMMIKRQREAVIGRLKGAVGIG